MTEAQEKALQRFDNAARAHERSGERPQQAIDTFKEYSAARQALIEVIEVGNRKVYAPGDIEVGDTVAFRTRPRAPMGAVVGIKQGIICQEARVRKPDGEEHVYNASSLVRVE